ncbi:hypothetical protein ASG51_22430 [Methylobacterium sp. Leaf465]|nr:hypothetical protein ASG51_22430 [Methylobacterium sp. Leaf465]
MTPRSFQTLVGLFPNLGPDGAWYDGQHCELDPTLRLILDRAAAGYDDALRHAIEFWVVNNERIVPFMAERISLGETYALANCVQRHTDRLVCAGIEQAKAAACAQSYGRIVKGHADRLTAGVGEPLFPNQEVILYRGWAVRLSEFATGWDSGAMFSCPVPLACTLNPDIVPLHFAWKRQNLVRDSFPGEPVAAIILQIRIEAEHASRLIWAGFMPHKEPKQDHRWQQEILAPPNFRFTVTSHLPVPGASAHLNWVEATGSFP